MSYYDRYLAKFPCDSKAKCQLVAVTSLYIAVKLYDVRRKDSLAFFAKLSDDRFSEEDICVMEMEMLEGLNWFVNPPTPQAFVYHFVHLLGTMLPPNQSTSHTSTIYEVANYVAEVSYLQLKVSCEKASTLAFASILVALNGVKSSVLSTKQRKEFVNVLFAFNFASGHRIAELADEMEEHLHTAEHHLTMDQVYAGLDPSGSVYSK